MFNVISFKKYILTAFDLKEDELKKTLLLQLNIFLLITTLLIVKPTINSLFLSELTSSALPLGYVLTAIMAIIGSFFYDKILEKKLNDKFLFEIPLLRKLNSIEEQNNWFIASDKKELSPYLSTKLITKKFVS